MKKNKAIFTFIIICAVLCSCTLQTPIPSSPYPQTTEVRTAEDQTEVQPQPTEKVIESTETLPQATEVPEQPTEILSSPTEAQTSSRFNDWESVEAQLLEVVSGTNTFFSHDFEKVLTVEEYCSSLSMTSTVKIAKYVIIDLDLDNAPEMVLWLIENGQSDYGFLILRHENDGISGYNFSYRQIINLKNDGTFNYSSGTADTGCARLNFTGNGWEYKKICNITETEDAVTFFCDGKEVSQETYWETIEAHNSKEEARWIPY